MRETGPGRPGRSTAGKIAIATAAAGAILALATSIAAGNPWALTLAAWAMLPYGVLYLASRGIRDPWSVGGAGAAALAVELGVRAGAVLFPAGSTSGIILIYSPILVGAALPAGGLVGLLFGRLWRRGGVAVRSGIVLFSGLALGLTMLGLARPELFPTEVLKRRETLSRIGEPGIVVGSNRFETVLVSERSAWWHSSGDLDGAPGEEIAALDHRGVELFEPGSLESLGVTDFEWKDKSPMNWFSRLARVDGRLVIVQTGGGYSKTEVLDIYGESIWSYRPDESPPPTDLRPADLDRDGETEFYAAYSRATARLDGAGREIWSRPTQRSSLAALKPRTEESPAWVVGGEYGRLIRVWNENGDSLAELPMPPESFVLAVVEWPAERTLLLAGSAIRGMALNGATRFEIPLADMSLTQAVTVRFQAGGPNYLVLSAAAPRHVDRWRLLILSPERETVYDEIFDHPVQVFTARAADGSETLLLSSGGLRAFRPVAPTGDSGTPSAQEAGSEHSNPR